jgi:hypothetical protein
VLADFPLAVLNGDGRCPVVEIGALEIPQSLVGGDGTPAVTLALIEGDLSRGVAGRDQGGSDKCGLEASFHSSTPQSIEITGAVCTPVL